MDFIETATICNTCGSANLDKFSAETGIRRPGLENIDTQTVLVFSQLIICLNCGRAEFVVPNAELHRLPKRNISAA